MDQKFVAHVAGELIVIGGLAFYTKRTADQLNARIVELEKKVKEQDETSKGIHTFLRNIFPPHPPPLVPSTPQGPTPEQEEEKRLQEILKSAKEKKTTEKVVLKKSKAKKQNATSEKDST